MRAPTAQLALRVRHARAHRRVELDQRLEQLGRHQLGEIAALLRLQDATRSNDSASSSMNSSSTPTVSAGPGPNRWSRTSATVAGRDMARGYDTACPAPSGVLPSLDADNRNDRHARCIESPTAGSARRRRAPHWGLVGEARLAAISARGALPGRRTSGAEVTRPGSGPVPRRRSCRSRCPTCARASRRPAFCAAAAGGRTGARGTRRTSRRRSHPACRGR
jgi:hypothetical protein